MSGSAVSPSPEIPTLSLPAGRRDSFWNQLGLPLVVTIALAVPATAYGAFFPTSWGWMAICGAWLAMLALVLRTRIRLAGLELAALCSLAAFVVWIGLSTLWSTDPTESMLEVEHALVFGTAAVALLIGVRRRNVPQLLGGVLTAITLICGYALATRLLPQHAVAYDELVMNRLETPLGYWNALGLIAAMGSLLAFAIAARARPLHSRVAAGAALPLLLPTLYFTFSRGAWLALAAGLLAALVLDTRRLQLVTGLLVLSPAPAIAVWMCSRSEALTSTSPALADASRQGHRVALIIVALALAGGLLALALGRAERRLRPPRRLRLMYGAAIWAATVAALATVFVSLGSPLEIARHGYRGFAQQPVAPKATRGNLNARLFSYSGNRRADYWAAAWKEAREHPWLGNGAGTYQVQWLRHRRVASDVRDAHSLYLETLAELGPPGLGLLGLFLAMPLAAAIRARRRPLVSGALAAYVAYLVHAGFDWDWEMTAVTLAAFACGGGLLVSARGIRQRPLSGTFRVAALVFSLVAVAFASIGLASNAALSESEKAITAENWSRAEGQARRAIQWAPWSSQGWEALGEAQLEQGKLAEARASFRQALAKSPHDWNLWLDLAFASKGPERRRAALKALQFNPLSPEIAKIRPALGLPSEKP